MRLCLNMQIFFHNKIFFCHRALLGDYCLSLGKLPEPKESLVDSVLNVLTVLKPYWTFLRMQDEYDAAVAGKSEAENCHRPLIIFKGDEVEKDVQYMTKVYDPKFHYSAHSPDKLAELMSQFQLIQSGYERNLLQNSVRVYRLAVAYDEVSKTIDFSSIGLACLRA